MRTSAPVGLFVLLLGLGGSYAAETRLLAQTGSSRVVVARQTHDFGTVRQGDPLVHAFVIRNEGTAPLTILRVDLSTPGTKTRFKKTLLPSESGQIVMEWDTSKLQGEFEAEAVVHLTDPQQPRVSLSLTAVVIAPIAFDPSPEVFFSAYRGETPERTVQVINNEGRPLTIIGAESPSNHYDVSVKTVRDGFAYEIRVKIRPDVPFGRYPSEPIYLRTDSPDRPRLQLLANLLVKPDFYAVPEDVNFGTLRLESLMRQTQLAALLKQSIAVAYREGSVEIERIESDVAALHIAQTPSSGSSQRFRLDVSLMPDKATKGSLAGSIRLITTNPAIPPLVIPVRGEVR